MLRRNPALARPPRTLSPLRRPGSLQFLPALACLGCVLGCLSAAAAQRPAPSLPSLGTPAEAQLPMDPKIAAMQAKARAEARQKKMRADAAQLLGLARQLQAAVDKTDAKNELSVGVIRAADRIEKLAKQIRENMSAEN